ncbi:hypothetical protein HG549_20855 [Pseudomonas sp. SK]|uniref:hypothetical protein n=1 Tax=Pseudomonas sp. SK TaxID=2729423 RepID=UPI0014637913|nr:hypothetical protein [Pseudomonas sp. SK]QJQ22280.1 hypothetical protein HG549_20855 [Pseudomonas sp. SK]
MPAHRLHLRSAKLRESQRQRRFDTLQKKHFVELEAKVRIEFERVYISILEKRSPIQKLSHATCKTLAQPAYHANIKPLED